VEASDEGCTGVAVGGAGLVSTPVIPGDCYVIRVGGFAGGRGSGSVTIDCGGAVVTPPPVGSDPTGLKKPRFISFLIPPSGGETSLRVRLVSLHHVLPLYSGGPSIPFTLFEGQSLYAGAPAQYVESVSSGTPFMASQLDCQPHYRNWNTISTGGFCIGGTSPGSSCTIGQPCAGDGVCGALLHVSGEAIVPSSIYEVQNLALSCAGGESTCTAVSAALTIGTTRWGDVIDPFNPPSVTTQPDTGDFSALVNKFKSALGAPIKARGLLAGNTRGRIDIVPDLGFTHISLCVDAFKGLPYPYKPGKCTGNATKACGTDTDCVNQGTTGPCILCP